MPKRDAPATAQAVTDEIALDPALLAAIQWERRNALVALATGLIATAAPAAAAIYAATMQQPIALCFALAGTFAASFALYHAARWFAADALDRPAEDPGVRHAVLPKPLSRFASRSRSNPGLTATVLDSAPGFACAMKRASPKHRALMDSTFLVRAHALGRNVAARLVRPRLAAACACAASSAGFPNTGSRILSPALLGDRDRALGLSPRPLLGRLCRAGRVRRRAGARARPLHAARRRADLLFFLGAAYDHLRFDGYFWNKLGMEYPALWGLVALYFACAGGGAISLDRVFFAGVTLPSRRSRLIIATIESFALRRAPSARINSA